MRPCRSRSNSWPVKFNERREHTITVDSPIKTASWTTYQKLEEEFRSLLATEPNSATERGARIVALAIRTGLTEVALEIKSHRFAPKNGGAA